MPELVQLKHVLLDIDFFDKPKVKALVPKFGQESQLFLIRIYALLSRATNAEMDVSAALGLAWEMRIEDKAQAIIDHCVANGMLSLADDGTLSSDRIAADQAKLAGKQRAWREWQARREQSPGNDLPNIEVKFVSEDLNTEDLKSLSSSEGGAGETVLLSLKSKWDTAEMREALTAWVVNLKINHRRTFTQIDLNNLLIANYHISPLQLSKNLAHSAANRWKNLAEKPLSEKDRIALASEAKAKQAAAATERPRPQEIKAPKREQLTDEARAKGLELLRSAGIKQGAA